MIQPKLLRENDYLETLGRFIETYAELEMAVSGVLWSFAQVKTPIARAIFSGTRADAASKYISRILDVTKAKKSIKDEFNFLFAQVGHITEARNLIIHNETIFSKKRWIVTNRRIAIDRKRLKERPISSTILREMIADLEKISAHLLLLMFRNEKVPKQNINLVKDAYAQELRAPWQYKPPQPKPRRRRKRQKRPTQRAPREPSPE